MYDLLVECVKAFINISTIKFKKWFIDYKIYKLENK